jgi:pyruvate/2-oxoacid:ferredoxin oxidoreductase alpha subunit
MQDSMVTLTPIVITDNNRSGMSLGLRINA